MKKYKIEPINKEICSLTRKKINNQGKPLYGLGKLEEVLVKISGIQETTDINIDKSALIVFVSDNGIIEEGVSQSGYEVTKIIGENFLKGVTTASIFADYTKTKIFVYDVGVKTETKLDSRYKLSKGTNNFLKEPAIEKSKVIKAIEYGIEIIRNIKNKGYNLAILGEMGIGNTTTSTAIASAILNITPKELTSRGAGLSDEGLEKKIWVIEKAIEKYKNNLSDPIDILSNLGGYDICFMVGAFIGAGIFKIPIIIDGLIVQSAGAVAKLINERVVDYMIPAHVSKEKASRLLLKHLELDYLIDSNLKIGEGSGGLLVIPLIKMALKVYNEMPTFDEIKISKYKEYDK